MKKGRAGCFALSASNRCGASVFTDCPLSQGFRSFRGGIQGIPSPVFPGFTGFLALSLSSAILGVSFGVSGKGGSSHASFRKEIRQRKTDVPAAASPPCPYRIPCGGSSSAESTGLCIRGTKVFRQVKKSGGRTLSVRSPLSCLILFLHIQKEADPSSLRGSASFFVFLLPSTHR